MPSSYHLYRLQGYILKGGLRQVTPLPDIQLQDSIKGQ